MQWKAPPRFNGLATSWRDTSVLRAQHVIGHSAFRQKKNGKVSQPPISQFEKVNIDILFLT